MAAVIEVVIEADPMNDPSAKQIENALAACKDTDSGHWSGNTESHNEGIHDDDSGSSVDDEEESHNDIDELRIEIASLADESIDIPVQANVLQEDDDENDCCIVCFDKVGMDMVDLEFFSYNPQSVANYSNLPCCRRTACNQCMEQIVATNVAEGRVKISCPHPKCGKVLPKKVVLSYLTKRPDVKANYTRFCVDIEGDGTKKTCPNCCHIKEHHLPKHRRLTEKHLKVQCSECQFNWCYRCQAPWHDKISCKQFQKGNRQFKEWTHGRRRGEANCQKCPTCRVYIQRSTGCPHMTCSRCDTEFCYDCGGRFLEFDPLLDHKEDNLELWGCPDIYLPDEPIKRNVIRGGWLGARISFLAGYPILLVGAVVLVIVGGAIALPIYGGYKLIYYYKNKRH